MADHSNIEWTDATWNPVTGCSILSPGCAHCYAMKLAGTRLRNHPSRAGLTKDSKAGPVWNGEVRLNEQWLQQPLEWSRPRMIFVCAHGDLFHENAPDSWIDRVFATMASAPQHTFQVLTKRGDRMRRYIEDAVGRVITLQHRNKDLREKDWPGWPLPNVWLGVSAERQQEADERIPHLLETPAAVRFVSLEPLLGPIDLTRIRAPADRHAPDEEWLFDALTTGDYYEQRFTNAFGDVWFDSGDGPYRETKLDWVIGGGESGDGARPMHPAWPRAIEKQCAAAGVAFHFKQWGAWVPICATTEELTETLYHPAPRRDPEAIRRCKVGQLVLHADGAQFRSAADPGAYAAGSQAMLMFEVGKKRAGRLLDGLEHNGMPERAP
ncbi:protein gp37 [Bradyrhizobium sp. i1.4.4]